MRRPRERGRGRRFRSRSRSRSRGRRRRRRTRSDLGGDVGGNDNAFEATAGEIRGAVAAGHVGSSSPSALPSLDF